MKKGAVISDLHSGSMYAPLPPDFVTYDGTRKGWNPAMEYLWKCWDNFTLRAQRFEPDFILVNGDCVEGPQRKSNGFELTLASIDDQRRACVGVLSLLKDRVPNARWFFTQGTPYHTGEWHGVEEAIAREMGAEPYWSVGTGEYCREVWWASHEGVTLEAAHHPVGGMGLAALDKESQQAILAAAQDAGLPRADLLIRSHKHRYYFGEHESQQILLTPCWKLTDRHGRKSGVHRLHPSIGGVFIEIDPEAKKRGNDPCRVQKELYPLPKIKTVTI